MIVTQWFNKNIRPLHVGVYEVRCCYGCSKGFAKWNGYSWGISWVTKADADAFPEYAMAYQFKTWRGLAEKPKAKS